MALFDRNPSPQEDEPVNRWAVIAGIAAGAVLAGVAYMLTRQPKYISIGSRAHASDGMLLATSCACLEDGVCEVTVRNAVPQPHSGTGDAASNEVSTSVPVVAREVCLHIRVEDGDFDSVPQYESGRPAAHVRSGRELIVFLGDMQPSEEVSLRVSVRPGE